MNVPIHDSELEQHIIGAMLLNPKLVGEIQAVISSKDFYRTSHQLIFDILLSMESKEIQIDIITVTNFARSEKVLDKIGGASHLSNLINFVPSSSNWKIHSKLLKEKSILRHFTLHSQKLLAEAQTHPTDFQGFIDKIQTVAYDLTSLDENIIKVESTGELISETFSQMETMHGQDGVWGISTGLNIYDRYTGGLHDGDLTIFAGRPSNGKTAFALSVAMNIAQNGNSVFFQSCEMPKLQLMQRLLSMHSGVALQKVRSGSLRPQDWRNITKSASVIEKMELYICDTPEITIPTMKTYIRNLNSKKKIDVIMIDYLQLLNAPDNKNETNEQKTSELSRSSKLLARSLNVPVVMLSQLSRAVESRPDKIPILSDLRSSGAIEQDADNVIFTQLDVENHSVDIHVAKQRNGRKGIFQLDFNELTTQLMNRTPRPGDGTNE